MIAKYCKKIILRLIEPAHGKVNFLRQISKCSNILDVGCGNDSPYLIKTQLPNITYTGIDIGDYNQQRKNLADNYILTSPLNFAAKIAEFVNEFDVVISSHNLEHCNDRMQTLNSMTMALKRGGMLYLSFPTEKSVSFDSRKGTLNYYDDLTHQGLPPNFNEVIARLKNSDMKILFSSKSYKPIFYYFWGMFLERKSKKEKQVTYQTWAYHGFEAIIWARKM